MKKLSILLIGLLLVAGFASAEVMLSMSGTSTLTWGIRGSLIDNSANFGDVNSDFRAYTDDSGDLLWEPNRITLTMEVADEDGMVIVKGESRFDLDNPTVLWTDPDADPYTSYEDAFQYIEFPNVVPGVLGVKLNKSGKISTSVTSGSSVTSQPNVLVTATPIDGLKAQLGLVFDQAGLDRTGLITVVYDTYLDFAASLYAEYMLSLGDEDSVTVAFGTVFDTAYGNSVFTDASGATTDEKYGPKVVIAPTAAPAANTNEQYGWPTLPIGLGIDASVMGITAAVDFETRLVQGADVDNLDATGAVVTDWEVPIFAGIDLAYEMMMGDITITPSANFKYSNDFWKWGEDGGIDSPGFEYQGLVQEADFIGRPMSAKAGVEVAGIAGLLDVDLSFGMGFGDGEYMHGTDENGVNLLGLTQATTLEKLLSDTATANPDTANVNDGFFADSSASAMQFSLGLTATPLEAVTVTNTTKYTVDNLGFLGYDDGSVPLILGLYGDYLSRIDNDTKVTYDIMVGETVAATLFGQLNLDIVNYVTESGETLTAANVLTETEQDSMTTLQYRFGVQVKVSTP